MKCEQCGVEYADHPAGDGLAECAGDFPDINADWRAWADREAQAMNRALIPNRPREYAPGEQF